MSRFFPQAEFAEDQPLAKTILTTHVLHRGFQSGALVGAMVGAARSVTLKSSKRIADSQQQTLKAAAVLPQASMPADATQMPGVSVKPSLQNRMVTGAARGSLIGTAFFAVALVGRMYGRDEIEWKDRSWRLQANEGQLETDDWSVVGAAIGAVGANFVKSAATVAPWKRAVGGAGLGGLAGVGGYMVYRYGLHGGKR